MLFVTAQAVVVTFVKHDVMRQWPHARPLYWDVILLDMSASQSPTAALTCGELYGCIEVL